MVGPDGDADDVLVAGAEDERDQQEEQEQGTRAPASHRLQGMKIYGAQVYGKRCYKRKQMKIKLSPGYMSGWRERKRETPPGHAGSPSASSATWQQAPQTDTPSSQPPCTQPPRVCNQSIHSQVPPQRAADTFIDFTSLYLTLGSRRLQSLTFLLSHHTMHCNATKSAFKSK